MATVSTFYGATLQYKFITVTQCTFSTLDPSVIRRHYQIIFYNNTNSRAQFENWNNNFVFPRSRPRDPDIGLEARKFSEIVMSQPAIVVNGKRISE